LDFRAQILENVRWELGPSIAAASDMLQEKRLHQRHTSAALVKPFFGFRGKSVEKPVDFKSVTGTRA
jgi:hypothetical protein